MKKSIIIAAMGLLLSGAASATDFADPVPYGSGAFQIQSTTFGYGDNVSVGNSAQYNWANNYGPDNSFQFSGGWNTMSEGLGPQDAGGFAYGEYSFENWGQKPCYVGCP